MITIMINDNEQLNVCFVLWGGREGRGSNEFQVIPILVWWVASETAHNVITFAFQVWWVASETHQHFLPSVVWSYRNL